MPRTRTKAIRTKTTLRRIPYFDLDHVPKRIYDAVEREMTRHARGDGHDLYKYVLGVDDLDPDHRLLDGWLVKQGVSPIGSAIFDRYAY